MVLKDLRRGRTGRARSWCSWQELPTQTRHMCQHRIAESTHRLHHDCLSTGQGSMDYMELRGRNRDQIYQPHTQCRLSHWLLQTAQGYMAHMQWSCAQVDRIQLNT